MKQKRIAILTLNPGIDRVVYLDGTLDVGAHNRSSRVVINQGSKGANQAIMLKNLGCDAEYFSFTGGPYAALCESFTDSYGIKSHYVETGCGVRLNIKVIEGDGRGTELNENGGPVTRDELDRLCNELLSGKFDVISLCGSFPQGVEKSVYNSLITKAKLAKSTVILDASGDGLSLGTLAKPYLIKPNRAELSSFGFTDTDTVEKAISACGKIYEKYGVRVLCTLDKDGSVYVGDEGKYRVTVAPTTLRGFSGAGDSYLAAFIYARLYLGKGIEEALTYGAAAACAKIALEGTQIPEKEQVEAAIKYITVEKI